MINSVFLMGPVLLPVLAGLLIALFDQANIKQIQRFTLMVTVVTSLAAWLMILYGSTEPALLLQFTDQLRFELCFDRLGRYFAGIVATLWPLTVLYAFEYMKEDERQGIFFAFFLIAFGVTLGVCFAGNFFTLYCFYELLTLSTVPLVMHTRTVGAVRAARTYFTVSLGGAAFLFVSMMYLIVVPDVASRPVLSQLFYLFGFFGCGVKAAVFPLHVWLPKASVAPTPVTALLHAVAVVKAGVFTIVRLTYNCYGTDFLKGSIAQYIAIAFAVITIFVASSQALKERHWKRRLAYSTSANLSYILFAVLLMNETGLSAGLLHMAFHAEIKILAFFCAGAVMHVTGKEYVEELDGLGLRMPVTYGCFLIASLGLSGIPPFSGFVSKWYLLKAAADTGGMAYIGAAAILYSALLTVIYMFSVVRRAFFPEQNEAAVLRQEADWKMLVPMVILACGILLTGLSAENVFAAAEAAAGLLQKW